jgi:hypothetical protein
MYAAAPYHTDGEIHEFLYVEANLQTRKTEILTKRGWSSGCKHISKGEISAISGYRVDILLATHIQAILTFAAKDMVVNLPRCGHHEIRSHDNWIGSGYFLYAPV